MKLTIHLHLMPRFRMHVALPPLSPYIFMAWCSVKHRDSFTYHISRVANSTSIYAVQHCCYDIKPSCLAKCSCCNSLGLIHS